MDSYRFGPVKVHQVGQNNIVPTATISIANANNVLKQKLIMQSAQTKVKERPNSSKPI